MKRYDTNSWLDAAVGSKEMSHLRRKSGQDEEGCWDIRRVAADLSGDVGTAWWSESSDVGLQECGEQCAAMSCLQGGPGGGRCRGARWSVV